MANQQRWQANNRLARLLAGRSAPDDPQISALAQRRSAWVTPEGRANPPASPPHRRPRPRAIGPRGPRPAFESPTPRRSRRPSHFAPLASEEEVDDAFARGRLENARARAVKRPRRPSLFGPPAPDNAVVDIDALPAQQNPGSARARAGKRPSHFAAPAPENRIGGTSTTSSPGKYPNKHGLGPERDMPTSLPLQQERRSSTSTTFSLTIALKARVLGQGSSIRTICARHGNAHARSNGRFLVSCPMPVRKSSRPVGETCRCTRRCQSRRGSGVSLEGNSAGET